MDALKQFLSVNALWLGLSFGVAQWQPAFAQDASTSLPAPSPRDQSLRSVVAGYRDDVRQAALVASQQPRVLAQLTQQQAASQQAFTAIISGYGQTKQGWFYDMARFPEVMHPLATLPTGADRTTVDKYTTTLPADLQETAWKLYRHHHDDLVAVDNLNQQNDQAFDDLIAPLDEATRSAFRQLVLLPDVLMSLTQQPDQTAQLGHEYQADPAGVSQQLATLHDELAAQNDRDLAAYQQELNQDPQARAELQQAGQAYAKANGYTGAINPNPAWPVNSPNYYQNPYPYWFGYPSWYGSAMWYPSAWWLNTGYYYGAGGGMVVYGLPSFGFSNWFFRYGYGGSYYPHLYNRFNGFYARVGVGPRIWSSYNPGFWGAARHTFGPVNGVVGRSGNWQSTPRSYSRSGSLGGSYPSARMSAPASRYPGMGAYHGQSWGGSFGGSRAFGGGGFRGGRR